MWDSIFGTGSINAAAQSVFGQQQYSNQQGLANQANPYQGGLAQQQAMMNAYNATMMQNKPRWVIDGISYPNVKSFAKAMFPDDEQAQMMLVLKYGDI